MAASIGSEIRIKEDPRILQTSPAKIKAAVVSSSSSLESVLMSANDASSLLPDFSCSNHDVSLRLVAPATARVGSTVSVSKSAAVGVPSASQTSAPNTVAEFLYQLTKMLKENNRDVIEWFDGKIEVHNPHKLASNVLHKYFRHSKYASFQRQLNYFGFRKLAGKGKMAPCSYVNDSTTADLRSLLSIKRKTSTPRDRSGAKGVSSPSSSANQKRSAGMGGASPSFSASAAHIHAQANPVLSGILHNTALSHGRREINVRDHTSDGCEPPLKFSIGKGVKHKLNGYLKHSWQATQQVELSQAAVVDEQASLAQAAVGKGIRHSFISSPPTAAVSQSATAALDSSMTFLDPVQLGMSVENNLSELANNYQKSLDSLNRINDLPLDQGEIASVAPNDPSKLTPMLSRDSSLVDLAMIPDGNNESPSSSSRWF